jgi:hypothetical protein
VCKIDNETSGVRRQGPYKDYRTTVDNDDDDDMAFNSGVLTQ